MQAVVCEPMIGIRFNGVLLHQGASPRKERRSSTDSVHFSNDLCFWIFEVLLSSVPHLWQRTSEVCLHVFNHQYCSYSLSAVPDQCFGFLFERQCLGSVRGSDTTNEFRRCVVV